MVRDALAEAARLLAVYSDKRPQAGFASLYFDCGDFDVEQTWFGEMFPGLAAQPVKPGALPAGVAMASDGYVAEYRAAYLASLARR
jgi:hypothetical protein